MDGYIYKPFCTPNFPLLFAYFSCTVAPGSEADLALRDRMVFPLIDDPPEYHYHRNLSVPSYTSLRRNSIDSVFASPSMLDMDDIPTYEQTMTEYNTPTNAAQLRLRRQQRRNTVSMGSISQLADGSGSSAGGPSSAPHSTGSLSHLTSLLRRNSRVSVGAIRVDSAVHSSRFFLFCTARWVSKVFESSPGFPRLQWGHCHGQGVPC